MPDEGAESPRRKEMISGTSEGGSDDTAKITVWEVIREFKKRHLGWTVTGAFLVVIDAAVGLVAPAAGGLGLVATLTLAVFGFVAADKSIVIVRELERKQG